MCLSSISNSYKVVRDHNQVVSLMKSKNCTVHVHVQISFKKISRRIALFTLNVIHLKPEISYLNFSRVDYKFLNLFFQVEESK